MNIEIIFVSFDNILFSFSHEQVVDEYESIDKRVGDLLKYIIIHRKSSFKNDF
jgi:hypothetical protein